MAISREETIKNLKEMYPKKCKMVDGRYTGGFDDHECDRGRALEKAISDMEKLQKIEDLIDTHTMSRYFTEEDLHKDIYEKIVQILKEVE